MSKKYDTLVYICRAQPLHNAHLEIIRRAAELAKKVVIVVGSANQPRTYKNPFTSAEREAMLKSAIGSLEKTAKIYIEHNTDSIYNDQAWAVRVQSLVNKHSNSSEKIGIIGHEKDESSFYLKMFPQWISENVELIEPLNATDIRDLYFRDDYNPGFIRNVVPASTLEFLFNFRQERIQYTKIIQERKFIEAYKKQFESLAYPPTFVTADAVVICSGHVLMIKRRAEPGRGLWALPGGFLNAASDRSVKDAAIRELREETGIKVPAPVLRGSIVNSRVFDAIDRSARGRTITHAFKIVLPDGDLPKVKGSDDALRAKWVPIADVKSEETFEDHFEILAWAIGV